MEIFTTPDYMGVEIVLFRSGKTPMVRAEFIFLGKNGREASKEVSQRLQMESTLEASETSARCWSFSTGDVRTDRVAPVLEIIAGIFEGHNRECVCELKRKWNLKTLLELVIQTEEDWKPLLEIPQSCLRFLEATDTELRVTLHCGQSLERISEMKIRYELRLELKGKSFDLNEISSALDLIPTFKLKACERPNYKGPSEIDRDVWLYETDRLDYGAYLQDAGNFVRTLAERADRLNALKKKIGIESTFYFVMYTNNESFEDFIIPKKLVSFALNTGTSVEFGFEWLDI